MKGIVPRLDSGPVGGGGTQHSSRGVEHTIFGGRARGAYNHASLLPIHT